MFRIAFNPELPLECASAFASGERTYAAGDAFDWRALGMTEREVYDMFAANLVAHPHAAVEPATAHVEPAADTSKKRKK